MFAVQTKGTRSKVVVRGRVIWGITTMFSFSSSKAKKYEDIAGAQFHELMGQPDSLVIDVRTAGEFAGGKLRGAQNIDISSSSFLSQIKNLPKGKTYLVYCRSGNR